MELSQIVAAVAAAVTTGLNVWASYRDGRVRRQSGKRLAYSFHIPLQRLGNLSLRMKVLSWLPDWFTHRALYEDAEARSIEAHVFLWNAGTDPISSEDLFSKNSLRIHVHHAQIKSAEIAFLSHATVGADTYVSSMASVKKDVPPVKELGVVKLRFEYLPPGHGAVLKLSLVNALRRIPPINVVGPVKELKQTTFAGTLLSLHLKDEKWLRGASWSSELAVNLSLAAMGGVFVGMALWGGFTQGLADVRYWGSLLAVMFFEAIYLISVDVRAQIRYRIPDNLAWWDVNRSERR